MRRGLALELAFFAAAALAFAGARALAPPPGSAYAPGPRPDAALRVLTWNVGGSARGRPHALRDEHLERVAETLLAADPDLACLQEVADRDQLRRLLRLLGEDWDEAVGGRPGHARVVALARRGTLRTFSVPGPERALGVVYRAPERPPLSAVVLHAAAFSAEERNLAVGAALDRLLERTEPLRLLAGDLNLDLDLDKRRDLFTDDEHADVETYNYVAQRLTDATRGTGPTAEPDRRLDYVFVDPGPATLGPAGPWHGRRVGSMDHDPVVADLLLP